MTVLKMEPYEVLGADLGLENPLPHFRDAEDEILKIDPGVSEEDRRYLGWRTGFRVLPYRMQDGYNRKKKPRAFRAWVLENDILRARILPELGGRIVSIIHKPTNRELLERNPVFQPANLALRNAWFSGGIEWNPSQPGHSFNTCSPVYAGRVIGTQGEPVLRIYEWDRVKCIPWQVDLHLPPGSAFLFARVRLVNPHETEIPMYWWTNIAVPESSEVRTLCPAENAIRRDTKGLIAQMNLPMIRDTDMTYPTQSNDAMELYFRINAGHRPWIAALDAAGSGLVHASTSRLKGRKMFAWGMRAGSRHWQEFLSQPGHAYYEIQAGLARTQHESIPMPAGAHWTWTEAFGFLEADPVKVHSKDYNEAQRTVEAVLNVSLPQVQLEKFDQEFASVTTRPIEAMLSKGSGWGGLERRRLGVQKKVDAIPSELVFVRDYNSDPNDPTMFGPDQEPWVSLLERKSFPDRNPNEFPGHFMVQKEWQNLLEQELKLRHGDHWHSWYHLGNMKFEANDYVGAREAWNKSLKHRRTGWTLRNLALLESREKHPDLACDLLRQAWEVGPKIAPLAVEYAQVLLQLEQYEKLTAFVDGLPDGVRQHERLRLSSAWASLYQGRLDEVDIIFSLEFCGFRENDKILSDLWFALQARRLAQTEKVPLDENLAKRVQQQFAPPVQVDFRLNDHRFDAVQLAAQYNPVPLPKTPLTRTTQVISAPSVDLAFIIDAWPKLSPETRKILLESVRAAMQNPKGG